jgi:OmpA-OmpF porin, OOP family
LKNHLVNSLFLLACAFTSITSAAEGQQKDPAGTHDNPVISRFAGSVIIGYQTSDFDAMTLPLAPFNNGAFGKTESTEGRITRIAYSAPAGKSVLEISSNFEKALQSAGFLKRYSCYGTPDDRACGDAFELSRTLVPERLLPSLTAHTGTGGDLIGTFWVNGGAVFVETARLERPEGAVDVVLLVSGNTDKEAGIFLQISEAKVMATGQVTVDAKGMSQGLAQQGHIALYGLHFETDSAAITGDSKPTLAQMASLMKSQPELKVFIVGHTDNTGTVDHNLTLSTQRAQAVVKALQDLGVPAPRMAAKGMASFGPVATNTTDEGKARNRRVELVAQ